MNTNDETKIGGAFYPLTQLKRGEKYTFLLPSEFGIGAIAMQITIENVTVDQYAQYDESVLVTFKPKGKRNPRGLRFHGSKSCAIWVGWLDVNTEAFAAPTLSESGLICSKSRYLSFDIRYMTDAIESVTLPPLFLKIN